MSWINYHTHCHFCDGQGAPRLYAQAAIDAGMPALGFSSHAPVPFPTDWTMPAGRLGSYLRAIRELRQEFASRIRIHLGLEIDYIPGEMGPRSPHYDTDGLDFRIGSVHYLHLPGDSEPWTVDNTVRELSEGIRRDHHGDSQRAVEVYYKRMRRMVEAHCPDIIGHFDLIKKNNTDHRFFNEHDVWYREAVFQTLDVVAASGAIMEVNTGGIVRGKIADLYPSVWILERCRELDIPITLSSDCHRPDQLTGCFPETAERLRRMGFEALHILTPEGWRPVEFDASGLKEPVFPE